MHFIEGLTAAIDATTEPPVDSDSTKNLFNSTSSTIGAYRNGIQLPVVYSFTMNRAHLAGNPGFPKEEVEYCHGSRIDERHHGKESTHFT